MQDDPNYQELLFKAIGHASDLAKELGHPPVLNDSGMDDVLRLLIGPETDYEEPEGHIWVHFRNGPDPLGLTRDDDDPVTRAVIADLLFRPARVEFEQGHRPSCNDDTEIDDADPAEYFGALRAYLASLSPHDVQSEPALLWELHAAGATGDLVRLMSVCDQLLARHPSAANRTTAIVAVFAALAMARISTRTPETWIAAWDRNGLQDLIHPLRVAAAVGDVALSLDVALGLQPPGKRRSHDELTAMLKLDVWARELRLAIPPDAVLRLIVAWCAHHLGVELREKERCLAAAEEFQAGLEDHPHADFAKVVKRMAREASAAAYVGAGRCDLAEDVLRQVCESDGSANDFLRLARCRHLQLKEAETLDAFEEYVRRRGAAAPREEFQATLALQYGLSAKLLRDRTDLLDALAKSAAIKDQGEELVSWFDPFYKGLSESARSKWWKALYGLSSRDYRRHVGDEVWNDAAAAFGETVNVELKAWIFQKFLPTIPDLVAAAMVPGYRPDAEKAVLVGQGTLGQHIDTLLQSRTPVGPLAKHLDRWLKDNHLPLWEYLKKPRADQRLRELNRLRGRGTHAHVTRDEAARIFELARDILGVLVPAPSPNS